MPQSYDRSRLFQDAYVRNAKTLEEANMTVNKPGDAATIRMAQSYLRSEVSLVLGSTQFQLPILTNDPSPGAFTVTPTPTEVRLNLQDVMFCCELGFFIYCGRTAGGNTTFRYNDMTFPDPFLVGGAWTAAGSSMLQAMSLWTTARLSVLVNNVTTTPIYNLKRHMRVPQGQIIALGAPVPTAAPPATGIMETFNEVDFGTDGYGLIWPNWVLNGGNKNQYTITYPQPVGNLGIQTGAQLWIAVEFHGYLAQNASSIMDLKAK